MTTSLPRLHIEFAAEAPVAALLRRGPSKWFHVLKWNTRTDSVEPGAWFHGRIYTDRCAISPDGQLLAYFATRYRHEYRDGYSFGWIAVSKLPWLTALVLWPKSDTWGGEACFLNNQTLVLGEPLEIHPEHQQAKLKVLVLGSPEQDLPRRPVTPAQFDGQRGRDQQGEEFTFERGCLRRTVRNKQRLICDLAAMTPQPIRSPQWAQTW